MHGAAAPFSGPSSGCGDRMPAVGRQHLAGATLDARYGSNFWNGQVVPIGKNFAWTDWLYGR